MKVKYQIFVSSTYEDLKAERAEVIKACLNMGHIPVGMEVFNAADEEQWALAAFGAPRCAQARPPCSHCQALAESRLKGSGIGASSFRLPEGQS